MGGGGTTNTNTATASPNVAVTVTNEPINLQPLQQLGQALLTNNEQNIMMVTQLEQQQFQGEQNINKTTVIGMAIFVIIISGFLIYKK